jgi:hypothetical protein
MFVLVVSKLLYFFTASSIQNICVFQLMDIDPRFCRDAILSNSLSNFMNPVVANHVILIHALKAVSLVNVLVMTLLQRRMESHVIKSKIGH